MRGETIDSLLTILAIIVTFAMGASVIVWKFRDYTYGPFERAELRTLPDGQSWICHSKRTEWKGETENYCVLVEEIMGGGGN